MCVLWTKAHFGGEKNPHMQSPNWKKQSSQTYSVSLVMSLIQVSRNSSFNVNFFSCLYVFPSVCVCQSSRGEQWHTDESSVVILSWTGPRFISLQPRFPLFSDWLRGLRQVSDRTGVELLTLPRLERNWLACVWVCAHFARQSHAGGFRISLWCRIKGWDRRARGVKGLVMTWNWALRC